jgi:hypothetical protein
MSSATLRRRHSAREGAGGPSYLQPLTGASFRRRRASVREAALPAPDCDEDDFFSKDQSQFASFAPSFRQEWNAMYAEDRYQNLISTIRVFAMVPAASFLVTHSIGAPLLLPLQGLASICASITFSLPSLRPFCVRNVDWLCAALVACWYAVEIARPIWEGMPTIDQIEACAESVRGVNGLACQDSSFKARCGPLHLACCIWLTTAWLTVGG